MKKRIPALLCALALVCALALPALGSSSTPVYLLAANDKFCDLGVLPVAINGVIYVPYSTFDRNLTGVDLGVYYGITPERGTILTLYSLSGMLTFTMQMGLCEDNQGNVMDFHAWTRNGIPYVPAAAVCSYFGLQYSFLPTTDRGTCIRITNPSSPHMDDGTFLSSARQAMTTRYNQVLQSLAPQPSAPAASATPAPPAVSRPPAGSNGDIQVYLSIDASQSESDLTSLFPAGVYALFLFTPESLPARASQVRKAVAAGHSVGLLLDSSLDPDAALAQLEEGNRLLSHIARTKTHIVAGTGGLSGPLRERLSGAGWAIWIPSLQTAVSPSTIQAVLGTRPTTVRLDLTATLSSTAGRVVSVLQNNGYNLRRPLETEL